MRDRLDAFLFAPEAAGRLRAVRMGLALVIGLRIALSPFPALADQPAVLFRPVWFLSWLEAMPPLEVIVAVQVAGTLAAVLAVVGWRERGTFLVAWASLLVLAGLRASRAKIQHNDLLLLLVAAAIVLAPVGLALLDRRRSWRFGWAIRTATAVLVVVYVLTGFQKVVGSGPAWVLGDNMRNVMYAAAGSDKPPTDAVALFIADRAWLAHVVAAASLALELSFAAILWRPHWRPWFALAAVGLHGSIWLTHGLDYSPWAATAVVLLIDWSAVVARVSDRLTGRRPGRVSMVMGAVVDRWRPAGGS